MKTKLYIVNKILNKTLTKLSETIITFFILTTSYAKHYPIWNRQGNAFHLMLRIFITHSTRVKQNCIYSIYSTFQTRSPRVVEGLFFETNLVTALDFLRYVVKVSPKVLRGFTLRIFKSIYVDEWETQDSLSHTHTWDHLD